MKIQKQWVWQKIWPRHFDKQIILIASFMSVLGTLSFAAYQIFHITQFEYNKSQISLSANARSVALGLTHLLIVRDYGAIEQILLQAATLPGVTEIAVISPSGRVLSKVQSEANRTPTAVFNSAILPLPTKNMPKFIWTYGQKDHGNPLLMGLDATELILWQPIEEGELGWLKINLNITGVHDDALGMVANSVLFALIGVVLIIFILTRLLRPTLNALGTTTDFAKSLAHVQGQKITLHAGSDEIEQLGHALNDTSMRLYAQENAIKHANTLRKNVLDASTKVSIIATDLEGNIIVFNRGAEQLLGYLSSDIIGKQTPALFHLDEEVQKRAHELTLELGYQIEGVKTFHEIADLKGSEEREWTYVHKNGTHIPISLVITPMHSDNGEIIGHLGIAQDITERKRNNEIKNEFVSTVSHELRTPLTAISGALGLIVGGALGEIPETAKQMINIAHKNSQRLSFLINDLLDMEKLSAGKVNFDMKLQQLMPLIEQSLNDNRTYGIERNITVALTHAEPDARVWVDHQRLLQVLSNLLSNAIKFSPVNGLVEIDVQKHEHVVRITVSDHGSGIPEQFRDRIFSKFSQADASDTRQKGGTGLGLAITRELVERMGGTIGFNSVEGDGASFYVELPLSASNVKNIDSSELTTANNSKRILVVEDESDIANLLSHMLTQAGYTVDIALNGAEALDALKHQHYAAMTLDLILPDFSGLEIIHRVRTQAETADLPIIVISVKMEEGRLAINGDFTAIEWLPKPIDPGRLLPSLKNLIVNSSSSSHRVLHVEDDEDLHHVISAMAGTRFHFMLATTLREARSRLNQEQFELIILDLMLPDGSGWQLLPEIRALQPHAKVVIFSGADITLEETHQVEAILVKSQVSSSDLIDTLNRSIQLSKKT